MMCNEHTAPAENVTDRSRIRDLSWFSVGRSAVIRITSSRKNGDAVCVRSLGQELATRT